ncbi:adenylate kinase 7 isoform X1 [Motacilla alba alba]|uniref:adenylate kinase 7 isoform X1 n=1 Tax=Motacilla alba alba TaxID=1094192 RepID=UPI0018D564BB|nr:adenylate kinase 7 isoform X1 [Motacilla alba alba]
MEEAPQGRRVFLNHLDSYCGRSIGEYLSTCVVGATLESPEEEEEGDENYSVVPTTTGEIYEIVGTLSKPESANPAFAKETYAVSSREALLSHLLECEIVLYNITEDRNQIEEATWAVSALHKEIENFTKQKLFILISTIMTWANTKPIDPENPEASFNEEDFRKRRSHPDFMDHINAEKHVVKLGKTNKKKLSTYVVASGHQYGAEEGLFHYFFKMCWFGETPAIPVFGDGKNIIPTIHIRDLAIVLQNVAEHRPDFQYVLAVDASMHTLRELIKCISKNIGPGKIEKVPIENAFLSKELTQTQLDMLFVNLRMESLYLKENFNINWVAETGLIENIAQVILEYKQARGLLPLKVCIHGPPGSGKSTIAKELCKHYKLHYVRTNDVISEKIADLEQIVAKEPKRVERQLEGEGEDLVEEEEEEEGENVEAAKELLDAIKENMQQNKGCLGDEYLIKIMKDKLMSMPCRNQGYVLDGFPETYEQAMDLFKVEDDEAEEGDEEPVGKMPKFNQIIIPEFIFSLIASDEFLINRIIKLPESEVAGTHYTEDEFLQILKRFRKINTDDVTVLNYFDELEIHPQFIDIAVYEDSENRLTVSKIIKEIGEPRNYGLTDEEKEALERQAAEERLVKETQEKAEQERKEDKERKERKERWEEWNKQQEEVKKQEEELLEAQSVPLRNYLMKNVMPTLMQGINECCRIRPDDPVNFLAEYLFKNSPDIDWNKR